MMEPRIRVMIDSTTGRATTFYSSYRFTPLADRRLERTRFLPDYHLDEPSVLSDRRGTQRNTPQNGTRLISHRADSDGSDGLLDVCGFRSGGFWRHLAAVVLRRHQRSADWFAARRRRLRITAATEVRYQIDGDPGGWLPLDIEVLPGRLTVVVPKNTAIACGQTGKTV